MTVDHRRVAHGVTMIPVALVLARAATFVAMTGLVACGPTGVIVGAGATVVTASQTDKGIQGTATDLRIRTEINHYLFQKDVDLFSSVALLVENGRVLLTGAVETPDSRIQATRLAWQAQGVREIINEIQVRDSASLTDRARDIVINKLLQGTLLLDNDVKSINYSSDTVNGIVYLFGVAKAQAELDRVINHARNIEYVTNVVSYVTLLEP
ncbi:MAG: BON domain-containing protein [Alphaproteobacteria bacterium]|nr:BON domain-containing protein [Alphaproteobacteria bacterium]